MITSKCLNIHFQRDYEYIHDIACDENGKCLFTCLWSEKERVLRWFIVMVVLCVNDFSLQWN